MQQRLTVEVARAVRHDIPLSVAVLDIDHFKQLNDSGGHDTGDEMLVRVARCLRKLARAEDTLGRVGGDEFAWILPETTREQALGAVERARRVIAEAVPEPYRITISAGICDSGVTRDPAQLIRLADGAARWIRTHHERPDGEGYPDELTEREISEGAAPLALSDAWDVMTISRPYSLPKTVDEALAECGSLIGLQFTEDAVVALMQLQLSGELGPAESARAALAGRSR